jgi:riboflavin kinase / FMN adenylyltransferase
VKLLHVASELQPGPQPVCAAIGLFDGVHRGHQEILRQTLADARACGGLAVAITFDCHPNTIVAPQRVPPLIQTVSQRLETIASLGLDAVLLMHFDLELSRQEGESFVRQLATGLGQLRSLCVGAEFAFGHRRSGNVALLRRLGAELGFQVHGLPAVESGGQPISSTRIRERIRGGDLAAAADLLGRPYVLGGPVVEGDKLGRQLGFPTANLDVRGLVLPPNGVYATETAVGATWHHSVTNLGMRPTLAQPAPSLHVETHLLDFTGDLYGQVLQVRFLRRLREERLFASLEELQRQIARDIAQARTCFAAPGEIRAGS